MATDADPKDGKLTKPTRSYMSSTVLERLLGWLGASIFSVVYFAAPLYMAGSLLCLARSPRSKTSWCAVLPLCLAALLPCDLSAKYAPIILKTKLMQCITKYFRYEEYLELSDKDIAEAHSAGKRFIFGSHPHGVVSFCGMCAAISSAGAVDGLNTFGVTDIPTAVASVIKLIPFLKNVLGVFGLIDAGKKELTQRLKSKNGSLVIYIGGMVELFMSSPKKEVVFLKQRKGFIRLALATGADVVPIYLFGNTTVLSVITSGPLASMSRSLGVSMTVFWGRFGLPTPYPVPLTYARGKPIGVPHIAEPTKEDVDRWHGVYCEKLQELFDRYKVTNPDYKDKVLVIQ